jgi:hypothetical protein
MKHGLLPSVEEPGSKGASTPLKRELERLTEKVAKPGQGPIRGRRNRERAVGPLFRPIGILRRHN